MRERKLASIQFVHKVEEIEGAENIELAKVLGWQVVVKKGEFKRGNWGVYFEIDSFLPIREEFEFLRSSSFKVLEGEEGFRIKTIKLRGKLSQGLLLPLSILPDATYELGQDVTALLGVRKYEKEGELRLAGEVEGKFPYFIPKTDEKRIQSFPDLLNEIKGKPYYITVKQDGSSLTAYVKGEKFGICSRNFELKESDNNVYWRVGKELEKKLRSLNRNIAIQGEVCGPGVQSNRLGLKQLELFVFNAFSIDAGKYLDFKELWELAEKLELKTVPLIEIGDEFNYSIEELLEEAKGNYANGFPREGIVVRPTEEIFSQTLLDRLSFKVVNNDFLLKIKE